MNTERRPWRTRMEAEGGDGDRARSNIEMHINIRQRKSPNDYNGLCKTGCGIVTA